MTASLLNLRFRLQCHPFRFFIYCTCAVEALVREAGLARHFQRLAGFWQVAVCVRLSSKRTGTLPDTLRQQTGTP